MGISKERGKINEEMCQKITERAGYKCEATLPLRIGAKWYIRRCSSSSLCEIHHKKYRSRGGTSNELNLIYLCRDCHTKTHAGKPWQARYRTKSWQQEGESEIAIWNLVSNLVLAMEVDAVFKSSGAGLDKMNSMIGVCGACGLFSVISSSGELNRLNCTDCGKVVDWTDVTDDYSIFIKQKR